MAYGGPKSEMNKQINKYGIKCTRNNIEDKCMHHYDAYI